MGSAQKQYWNVAAAGVPIASLGKSHAFPVLCRGRLRHGRPFVGVKILSVTQWHAGKCLVSRKAIPPGGEVTHFRGVNNSCPSWFQEANLL